jgi:hypothetical protein
MCDYICDGCGAKCELHTGSLDPKTVKILACNIATPNFKIKGREMK